MREPDRQEPLSLDAEDCSCVDSLKRSGRRGFHDWLFYLIGRYPYRCLTCGTRVHRWGRRQPLTLVRRAQVASTRS